MRTSSLSVRLLAVAMFLSLAACSPRPAANKPFTLPPVAAGQGNTASAQKPAPGAPVHAGASVAASGQVSATGEYSQSIALDPSVPAAVPARVSPSNDVGRKDRRSVYIAHRGFSGIAPENTIPAFQEAIGQGADGFELDMQITSDGKVVVLHDYNLNRTTNGKGNLKDLRFDEVRKMDAGAWFSPKYAGTSVPTLDEALQTIKPYSDKTVYCEIKGYRQPDDVRLMMQRIKSSGVQSHTVVSSFRYGDFAYVREQLGSGVPIGYLCDNEKSCREAIGLAAKDGNAMIHASSPLLLEKPELVQEAFQKNVDIAAWTVNQPDLKQKLEKIGIRSFITDQPVILRTAG